MPTQRNTLPDTGQILFHRQQNRPIGRRKIENFVGDTGGGVIFQIRPTDPFCDRGNACFDMRDAVWLFRTKQYRLIRLG